MSLPVTLDPNGRRGQFEITVDGRLVVERKGGLIAMLTKKPWPDVGDVSAAVREALGERRPDVQP